VGVGSEPEIGPNINHVSSRGVHWPRGSTGPATPVIFVGTALRGFLSWSDPVPTSRSGSYVFATLLGLLALLVSGRAARVAGQAPGSPREEIVAEIARLDSVWLGAYLTADVEAVRPILADDFVGQIYDTVMDRDDLLARVAGASGLEETTLESLVINVYDEVAVAHAVRRQVSREEGRRVTSRYAYTDVYAYRDGRWQCITGQSAPIHEGG